MDAKKNRRLNNFIFDLDGTLVDSKADIADSFNEAVRRVLGPVEILPPDKWIGHPVKEMVRKLYPDAPPDRILAINEEFRRVYDASGFPRTKLFPEARKVLKALLKEKKPLFVLTNKPVTAAIPLIKKLSIGEFFKVVFSPEAVNGKNKSVLLGELLSAFSLNKDESVLVGDSEPDVAAARENGIASVVIKKGYGDMEKILAMKPDYVIKDLNGLNKMLGIKL